MTLEISDYVWGVFNGSDLVYPHDNKPARDQKPEVVLYSPASGKNTKAMAIMASV